MARDAVPGPAPPLLEVRGLHAAYGGIAALRGVDLHVAAGEVVALIGPNGAGKTTLLNAVSGLVRPRAGSVRLAGDPLPRAPHQVSRAGLLHVPEGRQVLPAMTVQENLELGRLAAGPRTPGTLDRAYALFPMLGERRRQLAGSLSGGQQQMLAIARALMGAPRLLMLDEPSLGLAPLVAGQVFAALDQLNRMDGLTVLLVEQNARRALAAAHRAYVLEGGAVVRSGPAAQLAADEAVIAHYLGREAA